MDKYSLFLGENTEVKRTSFELGILVQNSVFKVQRISCGRQTICENIEYLQETFLLINSKKDVIIAQNNDNYNLPRY
ncbi:hypothetical protein [Gelidibacter japonicus]|uniref:hypothetical protein n=1 Tax=Gelidibacter japonicus TaxID=1962232 RepID=UPI003A8F9516